MPQLTVEGFKSFAEPVTIDIAPLTILSGSNSSGKSSLMQPLLLIKQTMEVAFDPGPLLLAGSNVNFASAAEMFWHGPKGEGAAEFRIAFRDIDGEFNALTFCRTSHGVDLQEMQFKRDADADLVTLKPGANLEEILRAILPPIPETSNTSTEGQPRTSDFLESAAKVLSNANLRFAVTLERNRCFFQVLPEELRGIGSFGPNPFLRHVCTNMLHLPGLRDNPLRFYPATQVGPVFPGVFQAYVASIIQSWTDTRDQRLDQANLQLRALGLSSKVATQRVDDTRVALRVGRLPRQTRNSARDLVNIADVGLGVSQTLPIIVALLIARAGQYVFLEQPEIHLHPRAQVALADLLVDAALRKVRVVCETHSYLLLRAIQEAAVRKNVSGRTIGLNWFARDDQGVTRVQSTYLSKNGSFGDWPNDFAAVEMEVEDRYLQAVINRERRS